MRHTFGVTQAGPGSGPSDPELLADATDISRLLREVRRYVEQPQDAAMRESGLTMPQVSTLGVLFDRGPLSLKDLSRELGLSHSTASGIVDRLERRGLARRAVNQADRRVSLIGVTDSVDAYARQGYAQSQAGRLLPALESASAEQRQSIKAALTLLHSLLGAQPEQRLSGITERSRTPARSGGSSAVAGDAPAAGGLPAIATGLTGLMQAGVPLRPVIFQVLATLRRIASAREPASPDNPGSARRR